MGAQDHNRRGREWSLAARIAERRHGIVTGVQLERLGTTHRRIAGALANGRLRRMHRGIYLLGPTTPPLAHEMAAVLACGPGAVLSHRSAVCFWRLLPHVPNSRFPEVTVPGRDAGTKPGITIHRVRTLRPDEHTTWHAIPVTTPARTLLDFASQAEGRELERAIAEAFALHLVSRPRLLAMIDRHAGRPGVRALRAELDADRPPARTRSRAEVRLLALIRDSELPAPEVNARFGRWEVDFLWREQGLVVEADGYASHSSPWAFERDYAKTAELEDAGLTVIRASWRQIRDQPQATLARIRHRLVAGPGRRRPG